ncbi:amidohydrolase family protein [Sphingomonas qomolangmaensis]|uniref:Amidohydrolase family protein n=1 Tax=Sphingomonas qomolangmaensis TaxID=2918765 RepID=A0ABY5LB24_9SPHN|nr:amidohydrolase family protein [Sphingomonas qomolangmaensis]UUL83141.1 amidohydrolase family protein [Sphingomonas qomolangmaensis]
MRRSQLRPVGMIAVAVTLCMAQATARAETVVLEHFTLIDGKGSVPQRDRSLVMVDGRITQVGPASRIRAPRGAKRENLRGAFVMPGLIDAHVHLGLVDGIDQNFTKYYDGDNIEQQLKLYAAYGVTSVYTLGTDGDDIHRVIADQRRIGRIDSARAFTSGRGVVFKGSYGGVPGLEQSVATPAEAQAMVQREVAKGDDFVKLWVDDEFGDLADRMPNSISKPTIDTAHQLGKKAVAHIFYHDNATALVGQDVDGFMHQVRDRAVDPALLTSMKAKDVWQIASTLSREASFTYKLLPFVDEPFFSRGVAPATIAALKSPERQQRLATGKHFAKYPAALRNASANFGTMAKAGVTYGMGTDSGPTARFPGYFAHWELELMVKAGVTPLQALTAATGTNARFLDARDIGTVEKGKWADLLVLNRDPTADIRNTRAIRTVYVAGRKLPTIWQTCVGRPADACGEAPK